MSHKLRNLLAVFVAALTALAVTPAFAAGTGTITITLPTNATGTTTYKVYKVFDADGNGTSISYTLQDDMPLTDAMKTAGFSVDDAGNVSGPASLDEDAISAIAGYVASETPVEVTSTEGATTVTVSNLSNGYYYITTTTGSLVTITSTNPNAEVSDKNTVTQVDDKKVTSVSEQGSFTTDGTTAVAEAGSTVGFTAHITVGKGAKNVKFHDQMSNLTLVASTISVTDADGAALAANQYTVRAGTGESAPDADDTFTIDFADGIAAGTYTITYNATVSSDQLFTDPATNKAFATYGDKSNKTDEKEDKVYNAKVTVNKTFTGGTVQSGDQAEFVLKNSNEKYYKITDGEVSWVDSIDEATKLTFSEAGSKEFRGLDNGTYTLIESKTPAGFKAAADTTIEINDADSTTEANRTQSESITNEAGTSLPSTGGMGTTLFTVVGSALVIGAAAVLVTRKRMEK